MSPSRHRIVIGVTSPVSLILMRGLPSRLAGEGWDVTVVSAPGPELEELRRAGLVQVESLEMARDPRLLADMKALLAWWRLLRRLRPDVILVGTPKAGMLGVLAGFLARVPVRIYHLRGLRLETATGASRVVFRAVEALTLAAATSTIAVSESLKRRIADLHLGRSAKIVVLGRGSSNGVDLERFRPAPDPEEVATSRQRLGLDASVPVIGYVGRLHPDKGLDDLVAASALLAARGTAHQLLVVGGTDHASGQDMVRRLQGLPVQVALPGAVPDSAPFYQLMDIHCLPTLREGFPNAVLEASASGVATVTTDATGAIDSVVAGETGYIVPVRDSAALADALEEALSNRDELARRARNARRWVVENYSRDRVQTDLAQFLDESSERARVR